MKVGCAGSRDLSSTDLERLVRGERVCEEKVFIWRLEIELKGAGGNSDKFSGVTGSGIPKKSSR